MHHKPLTQMSEQELDWISRFADRLRRDDPYFAADDAGGKADARRRAAPRCVQCDVAHRGRTA
jgi:hypothetical protein